MSGRYRSAAHEPDYGTDDGCCAQCAERCAEKCCAKCVNSKSPVPWTHIVLVGIQGTTCVMMLALLITVGIVAGWGIRGVDRVETFLTDNKIPQRFLKGVEFAERIADNPLGFLVGGKTDDKTRLDYGKLADKLVHIINTIHDKQLIEKTAELEKGMLTIVNRWTAGTGSSTDQLP